MFLCSYTRITHNSCVHVDLRVCVCRCEHKFSLGKATGKIWYYRCRKQIYLSLLFLRVQKNTFYDYAYEY